MTGVNGRGAEMIAIVSVLMSLALFSVILRVVARIKRQVGFGLDDYLCFFSAVVLLSMLVELVLCKLAFIVTSCPACTDSGLQGAPSVEMANMQQTSMYQP